MTRNPPEQLNIADWLLDARVREGRGKRAALLTGRGTYSYIDVQGLANRFAGVMADAGVRYEDRVLIALPDGPEYVGAFFGILKLGAVVVMVNPGLPPNELRQFMDYSRARAVVTHVDAAPAVREAAAASAFSPEVLVCGESAFDERLDAAPPTHATFPSHRDDPAIWLFSGGTTGRPKAVIQSHRSFKYTTECYAQDVMGYDEHDITLSVPKLYFGYATGSNLIFPFSVGAASVLFPEPATAETLFENIAKFKPTVLINVPTMINKMVSHADAATQDLSSLRVCTSAGEALPEELYERWVRTFGVSLCDGLGTAEMWHIFITSAPGEARPGTLGKVVPGFELKVCDEHGAPLPPGETGWLWVRGGAQALGYWQHLEKTQQGFRGDWYVSGDLIQMDADGYVTYHGRGDEMLKVAGKWLAPADVESCLLQHADVREAAVVGIRDADGLMKPVAYVVAKQERKGLDEELKAFVRERLDAYKHPRQVIFVPSLPRTHLGKVDRGQLRRPLPATS